MMKNEQVDALKNIEEIQKSFKEELERAKSAEVELLKTRLGYSLQMLQRSHKEAMFYTKNLTDMVKKREELEQQTPSSIKQALDHYRNISQKCEETITRLKLGVFTINNLIPSEFENQIQQIQSGKKLSELPQIFIPPPPPPLPMNFLSQEMAQGQGPVLSPGATVSQGSIVPPGSSVSQLSAWANSSATSASVIAPHPTQPVSTLPQTATTVTTAQQPKPLVPPPGLQTRPLGIPASVPQLRPPAPLAAAQGIVRPTSYVRPLSASLVAGVVHQTPKNSFEKLIDRLQIAFPRYNRADFTRLIQELRASLGNSLSGMTLDGIVQQITELISKHEREQNIKSSQPVTSFQPGSAISVASTSSSAKRAKQLNYRVLSNTSQVDETLFGQPNHVTKRNEMLQDKWQEEPVETIEDIARRRSAQRKKSKNSKNGKETVQVITKDLIRNLIVPCDDPSGSQSTQKEHNETSGYGSTKKRKVK
ncbi:hypothetical protein KUTeg_005944 [Tegillarca granosa]|uniref:Uncharacterized protein n=1 Tax=Tegillarca granosa TaxID=220873 RepID=A0ABQ9FJS4_TEGGR|nr:hypothetical protein KUTeg_005944 [Tegillarca granosa]